MKNERVYVNQLRDLILQIQKRVVRLDSKTKMKLAEASKWKCPNKEERILLNDLLGKANEFIELEKVVNDQKYTREESEKYFSYLNWFSSLNMLLDTFEVPLNEISFGTMSLKD